MNKHVTIAAVVALAAMFALLAGGPLLAPVSAAINTTPTYAPPTHPPCFGCQTMTPEPTPTWLGPVHPPCYGCMTLTPTPGRVYQMFEGGPTMYMPSVMR